MNESRFLFVLYMKVLNLLDEGRRTYSLYRMCVLSLIILLFYWLNKHSHSLLTYHRRCRHSGPFPGSFVHGDIHVLFSDTPLSIVTLRCPLLSSPLSKIPLGYSSLPCPFGHQVTCISQLLSTFLLTLWPQQPANMRTSPTARIHPSAVTMGGGGALFWILR